METCLEPSVELYKWNRLDFIKNVHHPEFFSFLMTQAALACFLRKISQEFFLELCRDCFKYVEQEGIENTLKKLFEEQGDTFGT